MVFDICKQFNNLESSLKDIQNITEYNTDCNTDLWKKLNIPDVIENKQIYIDKSVVYKITNLKEECNRKQFENDLKTRYHLHCICETKIKSHISKLLEVNICKKDKKIYGIYKMKQYDGDIVDAALKLTNDELKTFTAELKKFLENVLKDIHDCNVVHRDLIMDNILYKDEEGKPTFVLTDFEDAIVITEKDEERVAFSKRTLRDIEGTQTIDERDGMINELNTIIGKWGKNLKLIEEGKIYEDFKFKEYFSENKASKLNDDLKKEKQSKLDSSKQT